MLSGNKFISIFRRLAILMLVFFVFIINTGKTLADDPEYAGERRFLGDKYPADPRMTMGALNFNFPIISPPGRSGLQPDLELSYSSNNNDNTSLFGYGWSINIPYIERINRTGVDKLYSENIFYSSLSGELEEITSTSTIQYMSASLMRESEIEVEINLMLARGEATQNSDGSIDFHTPKEKMEKRTKNSKTFIAGYTKNRKEIYMGRFYSGEVNYFNEDTRTYEEIDTKLIDNPNKWSMDKASYKANIKKDLKDNFLTFSNQGQELYFSLVGDSKKSIKASKETSGKWKNKQAVYKNALGKDIDLSLSLNNEALIKEAVINNLEALGDLSNQEYYEITFKLTANRSIDIKTDGKLLSEENIITSDKTAEVIDSQGVASYIWQPTATDSGQTMDSNINIEIKYELLEDGIYMTKKIPVSWLKAAVFPVKTDATVSYYAGAGDGSIWKHESADWDTVHDATDGTGYHDTYIVDGFALSGRTLAAGYYYIYRGFLPFDTSGLSDDVTISAATLSVYAQDVLDNDNDEQDYITVVQTTQPSNTALTAADFDQCGSVNNPTEGVDSGNRLDLSSASSESRNTWALNSTGMGWISKTGYTKLGLREGHDTEDAAYAGGNGTYNKLNIYFSEYTGTDQDPYLEITYNLPAIPMAPTNLLTEDETNPASVKDFNPEFSAIYNDPDSNDNAIYYQIQVTAISNDWDSLMWDSAKTAMATTTEGNRCADISYGGDSLIVNSTYYWRIRFWDDEDNEGDWSDGAANFTMMTTTGYAAKIDNGSFIKYEYLSDDSFRAIDKKGTVYKFGYTSASKQDHVATSARVYKWMIEEIRDTNDNYIKYEYYKNDGQIYPSKIIYTGHGDTDGIFEVEFLRESRNDYATSMKTGFEVDTNYRINEIKVKVNDDWVRKYELNYTTGNNGNRSLINTITETGRDEESNTIALPVNDFDYQSLISDWTYDSNYDTSIHNPFSPQGLFSVPIGDFNSDGLPDILDCEETNSCIVKLNDGDGTGWTASSTYSVPSGVTIYSMATDVNGDGFADFLNIDNYYHETDVIKVYINNGDGTGWTYDSDYDLLITNPKYPSYLSSVPIGDFNGDGLPDIHHCPFGVCETYINNGDGTGWTEDEDYSDLGLSYPSIADVNADGLDDIFIKDSGTIKFYINDGDGTGWTYDSNYNLAVSSYGTGMPVGDFNGDGLPDILDQHDGTSCSTYLNDGDGTGWSISYSYSNAKCWALQVDVNGDGLTDEFLIDNVVKIYLNKGKKSDLLLKFTSSKGAITDVIYKGTVEYLDGSNDLLNPDLPSSMQTVYQEVINDGLGNIATSTYAYYGGDFYYNDEYDRRMAGFNKIVKTDDFGYITNTYYHQGNETASAMGEYLDDQSKINKIYRTEVYDDSSNLYAKTINKWENYNLDDDRDFVKMTESIVFSYDGDTDHKEKASTFSYDNYTGNLIAAINYGEVNGSDNGTFTDTSTDLASTTISYAASSTPYIFGLKSAETTYDYYNSKVKETKYYYDDLSNGNVDVGNLTKQEMWESDSDYINIENTYNSYGLITQTKDPRDKATNYVYDSYNLYIASSTNPLSQQTQFYYDYSNGQATETITPNNRTFETVFDALDRVKEEKQPDIDSPSSLVTRSAFTYYDSSNPKSIVRIDYLNSATSTQTYTYLDGFGRIIQERKEAEDSNIFAVKDFIYNKLGLLEKESLPYFSTGTSNTSPTATSSLYTIFYYDPLGRIVTSVNAVATTTYAYDDWQTTVTDGEGNTKDLYKDAYDNLIKVDEHNGASAYTTEYDYDLLGNLTKIEDALNNERYFAYNGLGRLLTAQDLHALGDSSYATTTYAYDDSGNITSKVDGKDQTINYTYDDINRVLTENYTGEAGTEIEYGYDWCGEGVGLLCSATSSSAVINNSYNAIGLLESETKTINLADYATQYDYDRLGNIILLTYPDDLAVKYIYNKAGLLESISKKESGEESYLYLIDNYNYNPLGQILTEDYANNVITSYTYDANELYRLTNKYTIDPVDDENTGISISRGSKKDEYISQNKAFRKTDGSVELYMPEEQKEKRNSNSKTYFIGWNKDGFIEYKGKFYSGEVHYFNEDTRTYEEIDTKLIDNPNKWSMDKASYKAKIKKDLDDNFMTFSNQGQELYFSLVNDSKKSIKASKETSGKWKERQAIYKNALGKDIDLSLSLNNEALIKEAVINNLEALGDLSNQEYYEITFKLTANRSIDIKTDGKLLSEENIITSNKTAEVIDSQGVVSYIWQPTATDSGETMNSNINIEIKYELREDGIYMTKRIPVDWLKDAVYPVRADATVSYYSGAGDGWVNKYGTSDWATEHDATTGTQARTSEAVDSCSSSRITPSGIFVIIRGFLPFPGTVDIDDGATVVSAKLYFYTYAVYDDDNDGDDWVNVVQGLQASYEGLTTADFDMAGDAITDPTEGSDDRKDLSGMAAETSYNWVLNNDGLDWIDLENPTKLAIRGGHDILNHPYVGANDTLNGITFYYSEETGTDKDPYLEVTYFVPSPDDPSAPTNLLTEGETNPTSVKDFNPEFSAIYNDPNSSDNAIYYQLQVSVSSTTWTTLMWDSAKTAMATTTEGNRSDDISYDGDSLTANSTYYWRIKFWDDEDHTGDWSATTASFIMVPSLQNITYEYDSVGNVTQITDISNTDSYKTTYFTYDDLYRLTIASTTLASTTDYIRTYTYNAIGNITNKSDQGDYYYTGNQGSNYANPHAVTDVASSTHAYDNNGNLTSDGTWTHTWYYDNRLATSTSGTATSTYKYDFSGNRVELNNGSNITYYPNMYYNISNPSAGSGQVATTTKHIFAGGQLIATIEGNGIATSTYYIHTDHLGGSSVISDSSGDVSQLLDYYPYGDLRINDQEPGFDEKRKFTGHEHDDDTSLNYMQARYQNPVVGRFLSIDPATKIPNLNLLVKPQELNSYSYVANNPLKYVDPTGETVELVSRKLNIWWLGPLANLASHSFLRITPDNPSDFGMKEGEHFTLSGYGNLETGKLTKGTNWSIDPTTTDSDAKLAKTVKTPDGMTDTQFINKVQGVYDNYDNSADFDLTSRKDKGYNCNNFSTTLIEQSGGEIPDGYNPSGLNLGLGEQAPMPENNSSATTYTYPNYQNPYNFISVDNTNP